MTHYRRLVIVLAVFALVGMSWPTVPPIPARAAGPWYVAPSGNDGDDCLSALTPCATINGTIGKAASGDTIYVATGTYTNSTGSEVVLLDKDLTLSGGWDNGFTTQSGTSTIDGEGIRRGVAVNSGVSIVVELFVIQNGFIYQQLGGGVYNDGGALTLNSSVIRHNSADYGGGGAYNHGTLILNNSNITDNTTQEIGGGIFADSGTVILNNSTVSLNAADNGGGIFNYDALTLNNSTVSDNTGGGIYDANYGAVTLNNSTVSGNTGGGGIINGNNLGAVTLRNSILAGNTVSLVGLDCAGIISSAGYNLIGNVASCTFTPTPGDLTNVDPKLGVLIGSPAYQPLLSGSPAIDAGNPTGCTDNLGNPLPTDQRGALRVGRCDIGAYEYTPPGPAASLSPFGGTPQRTPPLMTLATPLQAVVLDSIGSPVSGATVTFTAPASGASGIFANSGTPTTTAVTDGGGIVTASAFTTNGTTGDYTLTATVSGVITPASFSLSNFGWYVATGGNDANDCQTPGTPCTTINGALGKAGFIAEDTVLVATGTYTGPGTEIVLLNQNVRLLGGWDVTFTTQSGMSTIDGQGLRRGITVNNDVTAFVERFQAQNGYAADFGGGIYNQGTLTLNNSAISGNTSQYVGGGIYNIGPLTLNNSTVSSNTSQQPFYSNGGGGIYSDGSLTLNNSIVSGNAATGSGGGNGGGGIYGGSLTLNNSTVSGNAATGHGGGLSSGGYVSMNNSTISSNTATGSGGGIFYTNPSSMTINNSTISNNIAGGDGGGIYYADYAIYGIVVLRNSLVAGNSANTAPDCSGYIGSSGYSLIGNLAGCNDYSSGTGDLLNVDPQLGQLIGSPAYHPLLPGSPAIDAGNPAGCTDHLGNPLPTDQRGFARFGWCDIGAYELQPIGFSTLVVTPTIAPADTPLTYTITLPNGSAITFTNVLVTDTLPVSFIYRDNSLTATSGDASYANGVVTWDGSINAGNAVTITFGVTVTRAAGGDIVNAAVINGGGEIITRTATVNVPVKVFLPLVSRPKPRVGINGTVTENGAPAPGVSLDLRFYNGSSWSTLTSTTTDADGDYFFTGIPSLLPLQYYYVRYLNTTTPSRLYTWHTPSLSAYAAGSNVHAGHFDVTNIDLVSPSAGATIPLPYTFQWTQRPATPSDSYEFNLFDYADGDPYFYTVPPLGYVGSYTLTGLPPGFVTAFPYVWDMWVYGPDGGYGISYWAYYVTFSSSGLTLTTMEQHRPVDKLDDMHVDVRRYPRLTSPDLWRQPRD